MRTAAKLVAGVTPGKGGQDVEGVPVYDTVADAVSEAGANTSMIFVPARFAPDAIYEAVDSGIKTVICITEHIPAHEMLRVYTYVRPKGVTLIGPNCPGVLSPGKANVGIIPAEVFKGGSIGLVSRSGTLLPGSGVEQTATMEAPGAAAPGWSRGRSASRGPRAVGTARWRGTPLCAAARGGRASPTARSRSSSPASTRRRGRDGAGFQRACRRRGRRDEWCSPTR